MLENKTTNKIKSEIVDLFHIIDSKNKGYITSDDIKNSPKLIPRDILDAINIDIDSRLDLDEFAVIYSNLTSASTKSEYSLNGSNEDNEEEEEEDFDNLFKLYSSRDFITREDITNEKLNISNELFNQMDLDGDGKLTIDEYKRAAAIKTLPKIEKNEKPLNETKIKKTRTSIKDKLLKGFKPKTPLFKTLSFQSSESKVPQDTNTLNKNSSPKNSNENLETTSIEKTKHGSVRRKIASIKILGKNADSVSKKSSEGSIIENDLNGFHQNNHDLKTIDDLLEKIELMQQELEKEKEMRQNIENEYNNLKIDLRFATEKQLELEDEIKTLNKEKKDVELENKNLTFMNTILEQKIEKATEIIESLNNRTFENKEIELKLNESLTEEDKKEEIDGEKIKNEIKVVSHSQKISTFKEVPDFISPDRKFKFILLGNSGVGKTSFMKRICRDTFNDSLNSTIGFDFDQKSFYVDDKVVKIDIWDTAGQERYGAMTKAYYRGAHCFVCMYDVNEEHSFLNLRNWITSINESTDDPCQIVIIGNKLDLIENPDNRIVKYSDGQSLAKENNALYFEISTKDNLNLCETIENISRVLIKNVKKSETICEKRIHLEKNTKNDTNKQSNMCC